MINVKKRTHKGSNGVDTTTLGDYLTGYVKEQKQFIEIDDTDIISKLLQSRLNEQKYSNNLYLCPYSNEILNIKEIIKKSKLIDWNCAFCSIAIKSSLNDFNSSNFVCNKCYKSYVEERSTISKVIANNSLDFRRYCQQLLLNNGKKMTKWVRKS